MKTPVQSKTTLGSRGNELVLCMILDPPEHPSRILLGLKKRGYGAQKWNGFGGHPELGETMEQALLREIDEECHLKVTQIEKRGRLIFNMDNDHKPTLVHLYTALKWTGTPQESDEMLPQWFPIDAIPYDQMWEDDYKWIPFIIAGKNIEAVIGFDKDDKMRNFEIKEKPREHIIL